MKVTNSIAMVIIMGRVCWLCGANGSFDRLERHHIFSAHNRKHSEKYELIVWLCGVNCHRLGRNAAHVSAETNLKLRQYGQRKFMHEQNASVADFVDIFRKNYLDEGW